MEGKVFFGYLKYYDSVKKSGFVEILDGTYREVYTHQRYFEEQLSEGDKVLFEIRENRHGWRAVQIRKAKQMDSR